MPNQFYSTATLSDNMQLTPEGYLVCLNVPIARAGDLLYHSSEVGSDGDGLITVTRDASDLTAPEVMASFEGKPVTLNHPEDFVNAATWRALSIGIMQNVRAGVDDQDGYLIADLLITDQEGIYAIRNNKLREVSLGYTATHTPTGDTTAKQSEIIGNHIALVKNGRCGASCAIFDHQGVKKLTLKDRLVTAISKAFDQDEGTAPTQTTEKNEPAPVKDGIEDMLAGIVARLDKIEALLSTMPAEESSEGMEDACKPKIMLDQDTLARGAILAPDLEPCEGYKVKALDAALQTADGAAVISELLGSTPRDKADQDTLFMAASAMLRAKRATNLIDHAVAPIAQGSAVSAVQDGNKAFWERK
jgi:hypothetical protein